MQILVIHQRHVLGLRVHDDLLFLLVGQSLDDLSLISAPGSIFGFGFGLRFLWLVWQIFGILLIQSILY